MAETAATAEQRAVLEAFDRVIGREAQNLQQRPELTWQQLYKSLQREGDAVEQRLAPQRKRRGGLGARPSLRTRTAFLE